MQVLGFDTATSGCSAAVWRDGTIIARRSQPATGDGRRRGQAEALLPLILSVLDDAGIASVADLDRIAVTVGPGAFTGLRIALAAARGLALASGVAVVGVTSFDAVAHAVPANLRAGRRMIVAVDSRRAEPFLQAYDADLLPDGDPAAPAPADIARWLPAGPVLLAGDAAALVAAAACRHSDIAVAAGDGVADAAVVAALGAMKEPGGSLRPLYLRSPDVTIKSRA